MFRSLNSFCLQVRLGWRRESALVGPLERAILYPKSKFFLAVEDGQYPKF